MGTCYRKSGDLQVMIYDQKIFKRSIHASLIFLYENPLGSWKNSLKSYSSLLAALYFTSTELKVEIESSIDKARAKDRKHKANCRERKL